MRDLDGTSYKTQKMPIVYTFKFTPFKGSLTIYFILYTFTPAFQKALM
jgi:uncharacterized protein YfdQ (DUF2303 family)